MSGLSSCFGAQTGLEVYSLISSSCLVSSCPVVALSQGPFLGSAAALACRGPAEYEDLLVCTATLCCWPSRPSLLQRPARPSDVLEARPLADLDVLTHDAVGHVDLVADDDVAHQDAVGQLHPSRCGSAARCTTS